MTSLEFLQYTTSIAVIIVALFIISMCAGVLLLVIEIRKTFHALRQTTEDIKKLRENMESGLMGNIISFGKAIFQKK